MEESKPMTYHEVVLEFSRMTPEEKEMYRKMDREGFEVLSKAEPRALRFEASRKKRQSSQ